MVTHLSTLGDGIWRYFRRMRMILSDNQLTNTVATDTTTSSKTNKMYASPMLATKCRPMEGAWVAPVSRTPAVKSFKWRPVLRFRSSRNACVYKPVTLPRSLAVPAKLDLVVKFVDLHFTTSKWIYLICSYQFLFIGNKWSSEAWESRLTLELNHQNSHFLINAYF